MKLIVGLGNPGRKYEQTRHNLGFMVVEELARKWTKGVVCWEEEKKFKSLVCRSRSDLLLVKPQTYMNNSGIAVAGLVRFFKVLGEDLWVIHDDLDITAGRIKISKGRGTAGHHGVASIIETLSSTDFVRFRLGIGQEKIADPEKFVLEPFLSREISEAKHMIKQTLLAVEAALNDGIEKAMTRFNR